MNSKTNNKNGKDSSSLSCSSSQSPYNLRRNQSKPGAVGKRSSSTKSRREFRIVSSPVTNQNENFVASKNVRNSIEFEENEHTNDSEQDEDEDEVEDEEEEEDGDEEEDEEEDEDDDDDDDDMKRSDKEEEFISYMESVKRAEKKLKSVREYFEQISASNYLCSFCSKYLNNVPKSIRVTICLKSNTERTFRTASSRNDANLRSHLGRAHRMHHVMYQSQQQQRLSKMYDIKPERKLELDEAIVDCIITDGRAFGDFCRSGLAKFLNVACPGYKAPSRKTVRRCIGLSYHAYRTELRSTLAAVDFLAITVDIWTKRQSSFICLTGHVFNQEFKSISIVLGFRHIVGRHRADKIKQYILYELDQLQIKDKVCAIVSDNGTDIVKAVKDIMSGKRFSCIAHDLNRVVKNGLGLWNNPNKKNVKSTRSSTQSNQHLPEDFYDTQSGTGLEDSDDTQSGTGLQDSDDTQSGTSRINSSANHQDNNGNHTSTDRDDDDDHDHDDDEDSFQCDSDNYSDLDVESENENDFESEQTNDIVSNQKEQVQKDALNLTNRIRTCIKHIRSTKVVFDYVKRQAQLRQPQIKCNLVTDIQIRWNTTYIMMSRLLQYQFIIYEINRQPTKILQASKAQRQKLASKQFEFTIGDWRQVTDLCAVLKPFFGTTNIISGKNYPTLALLNSALFALSTFLFTEHEKDSIVLRLFKSLLGEMFKFYFEAKMPEYQKQCSLIAAFLDPAEYKQLRKRPMEFEQALTLLKMELTNEAQRLASGESNSDRSTNPVLHSNTNDSSTVDESQFTMEDLYRLCGAPSSISASLPKTIWLGDEEIGYYMSTINNNNKRTFSSFWNDEQKRLPLMSAVVRRTNIIPASVVPSESVFSVAGYIQRKQRNSLSPKTLRYLLVLKDRHKLELLKPQIQK